MSTKKVSQITSAATANFVEDGTGVAYTIKGTVNGQTTGLIYSISGANAALFTVNSSTGAVSFKKPPNYETQKVYQITVKASNGTQSASEAVTINITDLAPKITSATTGSFTEGTSITTTAYTIAANDQGATTGITYSLAGTDAALFNVNSSTGAVTFKTAPNYQTKPSYSITAQATDAGGTTTQAVVISIKDLAPTITSATTGSFTEGTSITTPAYTIAANDQGATTGITYSLAGTDATLFNVNSHTGVVTLKTAPNYQTKPSYSITAQATDAGGTTNQAVTINITNVPGTVTISGTPTQGDVLTANVSDPGGLSGVTIAYQWEQSNNGTTWTNIAGANSQTLTLTEAQANQDVEVQATYVNNAGASENIASTDPVVSAAPNSVTISGTAQEYQTLTANVTVPGGLTGVTTTYQWEESSNNGTTWTNISGATSQTLTLSQAQVNDEIQVIETSTDGGNSESATSSPTSSVANVPGTVTISGTPTQGDVLTANVSDPGGLSGVTIAYQWEQSSNGTTWTNIAGANSQTLTLTEAQVNQDVEVQATYVNNAGASENIASTDPVVSAAPNSVTISGTPTQGDVLTANVSVPGGLTGVTTTYQWQESSNGTTWTNISGATSQTLTLSQAQVNDEIEVTETSTDGGNSESATSSPTSSVVSVNTPATNTDKNFTNEFVGPLSSWVNVTSFGATGNGVTDDTQAIQNALNELGQTGQPTVLYLPAGTYKITQTLNLTDAANVTIVGASPDSVSLDWAGAAGGTMLNFENSAYTQLERITLNGNNTAGDGLDIGYNGQPGGFFPTTFGISNDVFENMQTGILGGSSSDGSASEVSIEGSQFINNSNAGVETNNYNSLDFWIQDSLFQNNYLGVYVNNGQVSVYNSVFENSTGSDIYAQNNAFMGIHNNYSSGSKSFFGEAGPSASQNPVDLENNVIMNPTGLAVYFLNEGPITFNNNTIVSSPGSSASPVLFYAYGPGDVTAIGNTFTVQNPIDIATPTNNYINLSNSVVSSSSINIPQPTLPSTPQQTSAPIINVTTMTGAAIQAAINQAVQDYPGQSPIVHLQPGDYTISSTIIIPTGSGVTLTGDTGYQIANNNGPSTGSTVLSAGPGLTGPVLEIEGPSYADVQDFSIVGNSNSSSEGIVINGVDQSGGNILLDQVSTNSADSGTGLTVQGLNSTIVNGINDQFQGVNVIGGGNVTTSSVNLVGGSNGPSFNVGNGGNLLVEDNWFEQDGGTPGSIFNNLTGSGNLTLENSGFFFTGSAAGSNMTVDNFTGQLIINNDSFSGVSMNVSGNNSATNVLVQNSTFSAQNGVSPTISNSATAGQISFQGDTLNGQQYQNTGTTNSAWLSSMLGQISQGTTNPLASNSLVPSGATNLVLDAIGIQNVNNGLVITN